MALSKEKLNEIISATDFDQLIGEVENLYFDCKSSPYQVQNDSNKRELAKDVTSFANIQGGYILVGVKTKKSLTHFGDEVEEIRPFAQTLVNITQYKDILKDWIYPELEDVEVEWKPTKSNTAKGIIVIKIPFQRESIKPFLIVKTLDGNKQVETVFGYAERKGENSQTLKVADLQRALRSGFNYENTLKEKLAGMEAILRESAGTATAREEKKIIEDKIEERINKTLEHDDIRTKRVFIISAYPKQTTILKTIFNTSGDGIRKALENPPILRQAGWSLETLDRAKIVRGEMIRVTNGNRKVIDLFRDGVLIFAGLADGKFLAWGKSEEKPKISSIGIVELVYNFVSFYQMVLQDCNQPPQSFSVRIDVKNMHLNGVKNYLSPYTSQSFSQMFDDMEDAKEAPDNEHSIVIDFNTENFNVGKIAFEVLKEFYLWFGLEEDKIPYVKEEGGIKMVNPEAIVNAK